MLEELDPFDFLLAEQLHRTVREMRETVGNDEYLAWRGFNVYREAMRDMKSKPNE